ncbi:hypothetical protein IEO21_05997 [Rhodonia placenta]|uniref:histone deacetylase n=1 Tax=Rhodonia placenta TaxID=104341 RepID=A0A8H7P0W8_9APHY|nr:hypothetical protein IEO21_05997 [Postia placenta]
MKPQRMRMTHELVSAYGMLDKMHILRAKRASAESMTRFHTDEYIHFLSRVTPENFRQLTFDGTRFLIGDDNPAFEGVFEFCSISAGGSLAAAQRLASGATDIAINWAGGLHHAKKREASGFCYINDIVLAILELLRSVPRVLYIDIDCHHGDGVEEAFYTTDRVMTCSFHKYGEYFPGTGTLDDRGRGRGKGYAVNVPLRDGITDESFRSVFEPVIDKIMEVFRPSAIVLQCGADSLAGDRLGCFNLSMQGHANCLQYVRALNMPLILLGGGGYTVKNVARTWAYETACALGIQDDIDPNLPWNEYFEWFGPRYRLEVLPNNMDDMNMRDGSLEAVKTSVLKALCELPHAPSVGLHEVPRDPIGVHLGLTRAEEEEDETDELDRQLARHTHLVYGVQEVMASEETDDADSDSDSSVSLRRRTSRSSYRRSRRGRKRMSITTNQYLDVPRLDEDEGHGHIRGFVHHAPALKRRFFQSAARWDAGVGVLMEHYDAGPRLSVAEVMERGGRAPGAESANGEEDEMDMDDADDEDEDA